jgi:hypothetical protein
MSRRLSITLDDELEAAISEAPKHLRLDEEASDAERLREYARRGYEAALQEEIDQERLKTYRAWASDPGMGTVPRNLKRRAARHKLFTD